MPITLTTISSGADLTESVLNDLFASVEKWINGGIETADLQTSSEWIETYHIIQPEFYGSPSPRAIMPTTEIHYREQFDKNYSVVMSNDFIKTSFPIPGLSKTFHNIQITEDPTRILAIFHCNFLCFENFVKQDYENAPLTEGALNWKEDTEIEVSAVLAGYFQLYVNGSPVIGTRRNLYWNFGNLAVKNHSISAMFQLDDGVNDISVRFTPQPDPGTKTNEDEDIAFYQIFVQSRNCVLEAMYR